MQLNGHKKIKTVGVVGMGYVGIPSAVCFAKVYDFVWGFQRDSDTSGYKIEMLNRGEYPFKGDEPHIHEMLDEVVRDKKFVCTSDMSKLAECDVITVAIQTPIKVYAKPLEAGLLEISKYLQKGQMVIVESTIAPGTMEYTVVPLLERETGLVAGIDFYLAYAPERITVRKIIERITSFDRVVGGINEASTKRAIEFYTPILTKGKFSPMTAREAEVTKTAENSIRDVQIATANHLALLCELAGVNFWNVKNGISTHGADMRPFWGILNPGTGVGGHCLPKDPILLATGTLNIGKKEHRLPTPQTSLFLVARSINDSMPSYMYELWLSAMARAGKETKGSHIALLGWAYTGDTDDTRDTPSTEVMHLLQRSGAKVSVHDPYVEDRGIMKSLSTVISNKDAVLICTDHSEYRTLEPTEVKRLMNRENPVIIDGRNMVDAQRFIDAGFSYKGIGRGDVNYHKMVGI